MHRGVGIVPKTFEFCLKQSVSCIMLGVDMLGVLGALLILKYFTIKKKTRWYKQRKLEKKLTGPVVST